MTEVAQEESNAGLRTGRWEKRRPLQKAAATCASVLRHWQSSLGRGVSEVAHLVVYSP
jgi:hypothetical protein